MADKAELTQLLLEWRQGKRDAPDRVLEATYDELRRVARGMMRGERSDHTLQATALVHEAYLRLFRDEPIDLESRGAFFGLMAAQMRRHLIDHARQRAAVKRGGGVAKASFDEAVHQRAADESNPEAFLARLDAALDSLAVDHPRVAEVIRLRFFGDLSIDATARELNLSSGTVKRDFAFGRAWLSRELGVVD